MIRNEFVENIASIAMMARVDSQTNLGEVESSTWQHGQETNCDFFLTKL